MNKKIRVLIIASILGLIALSLIQGYLIKNTYQLKKDAYLNETRHEIGRLDNYLPELDSLNDKWQDYFIKLMEDYHKDNFLKEKNTKHKKELIAKLLKKADSLNGKFIRLYKTEIKKKGFLYPIKVQRRVSKIVISDSLRIDTIFSDNYKTRFYLIGDKFDYKKAHTVGNSKWMTEHDYEIKNNNNKTFSQQFYLEFETTDYMNVDGWKSIVFKRMFGVFAIAVFIFLFVFSLLYYSIKNLIKQKKIADVKTDFVNNITHELKTPLATLTLATKMLSNDSVKQNEIVLDSTIQTIERQNKRLQKLIDQVLDNSLGYQEIKLKKEKVNLNDYLNTVLDDFSLSVKDKNVAIKRNFSKSTTIQIDKFYFTTAVLNILENAVKYNSDVIIIEVKVTINNKFTLSIKDNGIGIPKEAQKNLFEKFYRVDNKDVHNVKGLGLGLYYTNQIIKAHNGNIKVNSEEQKGTEFVIEIPFFKISD